MAQKMFEKSLKKDLGKIRSITKFQIREYQIGDEESIEEIIENNISTETKELSLFEKSVEILCSSPYIHLYKIPSPKLGNEKCHYGIYPDKETLENSLKEEYDEMIENAKSEKKEVFDLFVSKNEKILLKMISGAKEMSGQEIKGDKNAIKFIGSRGEECYNAIISTHTMNEYKELHKYEIVKENIEEVIKAESIFLYKVTIDCIENSEILMIARNDEQAKTFALCSDYILDKLRNIEGIDIADALLAMNIKRICSNDTKEIFDNLDKYLNRETIATIALTSTKFSIKLIEEALNNAEKVKEKDKDELIKDIIKSGVVSQTELKRLLQKVIMGGKDEKGINNIN